VQIPLRSVYILPCIAPFSCISMLKMTVGVYLERTDFFSVVWLMQEVDDEIVWYVYHLPEFT
jgi:hypothetical protein